MLTKYERELVEYWKNWKSGMGAYGVEERPERRPVEELLEVHVDVDIDDLADKIWDII